VNRQYVVAVALLGIAACTTQGGESLVADAQDETSAISADATVAENTKKQADEATVADQDDVICARERLTGSRIAKTVCLTRAEREKIREVSQGNWEAERRTTGVNTPPN